MIERPWVRRSLLALLALVVLAPVFGLAAEAVGYAEPLEHAARATGAVEHAGGADGLLSDYTVPGLGPSLGTLVSALVGTALTLTVALGAGRVLGQ